MVDVSFSLLGGAGWQFFDNSGNILSGGRLYTFEAGSSTPAPTYTDHTGNVSNGVYVQLDSAGRPSAEIWLLSGQSYKVEVRTAAGASIRTYDYVPSALSSAFQTLLAGSAGAGMVGYSATASYPANSVGEKLQQSINVKDAPFNAAVDGVTDDTAAFAAAIAAAAAGCKILDLAEGVMVVEAGVISIAGNDLTIRGAAGCTIKHKASSIGHLLTITGANCKLLGNFTIDGNSANQTYAYNYREILVSGPYVGIDGLRMINAQSMGIGIVNGALQPYLNNVHIEGCGDFPFFVNPTGGGASPDGGVINNCTAIDFGLEGDGGAAASVGFCVRANGWRIAENLAKNTGASANDQLGFEVLGENNIVIANEADGEAVGALEFGISIAGSGIVANNNRVLGTESYAMEIAGSVTSAVGNIVTSPRGSGISINLNSGISETGNHILIADNQVKDTVSVAGGDAAFNITGPGGTSPVNTKISNNLGWGLSTGFYIDPTLSNFSVTGNQYTNTGSTQAGMVMQGTYGAAKLNQLTRVAAAGTGNGGHMVISGQHLHIQANDIIGNGRMDNAYLLDSSCADIVVDSNFSEGATVNISCSSTDADIFVRNNNSPAGNSLDVANYSNGNLNMTTRTLS